MSLNSADNLELTKHCALPNAVPQNALFAAVEEVDSSEQGYKMFKFCELYDRYPRGLCECSEVMLTVTCYVRAVMLLRDPRQWRYSNNTSVPGHASVAIQAQARG
jgi:hypothetical protein